MKSRFFLPVLVLVLSVGASYALAYSTWKGPTAAPPGNNTDAPVNVGNIKQTKIGGDICTTVGGVTKCIQDISGATGVSFTYYCFIPQDLSIENSRNIGTPLCADAGGNQGYCPSGYTQKISLGSWGYCQGTYSRENFFLPPGGSCDPGAPGGFFPYGYRPDIVGSAYVCSK